jgi:hypothetical protein
MSCLNAQGREPRIRTALVPELLDRSKALDAPARVLLHNPALQLVSQDFPARTTLRQCLLCGTLKGSTFRLHHRGTCYTHLLVHGALSYR